jgi:hypothetical protein
MKKTTTLALVAALAMTGTAVHAADTPQTEGWRFQVGLTFISGMSDLKDKIQTNNPAIDVQQGIPGGLAFSAYRAFGNGVAAGLTIGPTILGMGDASFHIVPVGLDVRYTFVRQESMASYVRVGAEKAIAGGDFVKSGGVGGTVGLGVEFAKPQGMGWGIEAAYHSSDVKVLATPGHAETKAKPYQGTLAVYFLF